MKTIPLFLSLFASLSLQAATWTFHTFNEEYFRCVWETYNLDGTLTYDSIEWSTYDYGGWFGFHQITQQLPDGTWTNISTTIVPTSGTWTTDAPVYDAYNSGPGPDYNWSLGWFDVSIPGEYWIDFDSFGFARASTTQPTDFGKYLWDGSINPSWVEPLAKRGKAKGHH